MSDSKLGIIAIMVSGLALLISFWQAWDSRQFNKLTFKPHLQVNPVLTGEKNSGLYLENAGTGTAFIQSISFVKNEKNYNVLEDGPLGFYAQINVNPLCYKQSWPRPGAAIQAGKVIPLIKVTEAKINQCVNEVTKLLFQSKVKIHIEYLTPYDEKLEYFKAVGLNRKDIGL